MKTLFNQFTNTEQEQKQEDLENIIAQYMGSFEPRLYHFEGYMNTNLYSSQSTKPFMENLDNLIGEPVQVGHRYFESKEQLEHHLKWPKGSVWENPLTYGTTAIYISSHASKEGLELPMGRVTKNDLLNIFNSEYGNFPNILYFGCCNLFEDDEFGWNLLESSHSRGVLGFKNRIGFSVAMITDLIFFSLFYLFAKKDNPFDHLKEIYQGVLESFPVAEQLGFTLYA
jgi:hypothetical protein